jgi:Mn-dependent DtxR family transcriptional regulator
MLGVPRQTVTNAVRVLERAGLIDHHRGFIRITDAQGLEEASCECYATIRAQIEPA